MNVSRRKSYTNSYTTPYNSYSTVFRTNKKHEPEYQDLSLRDIHILKKSLEEEYDTLQSEYRRLLISTVENPRDNLNPQLRNLRECIDYKAKQIYLLQRYERLHYREPIPVRNEDAAQKKREALKLLWNMRKIQHNCK